MDFDCNSEARDCRIQVVKTSRASGSNVFHVGAPQIGQEVVWGLEILALVVLIEGKWKSPSLQTVF